MDKILQQAPAFKLTKKTKNHNKWYEVQCLGWSVFSDEWDQIDEVRDFFDPNRSKSGRNGTRWKFKNLKDAEKMYMLALLKW